VKVVQELLRHGSLRITMDGYTPGGDTGQAQCAGKSCGGAAGDEERLETGLRVVCPRCIPAKNAASRKSFIFVGVPDGI
jgi:hypothetical protein